MCLINLKHLGNHDRVSLNFKVQQGTLGLLELSLLDYFQPSCLQVYKQNGPKGLEYNKYILSNKSGINYQVHIDLKGTKESH